MDGDERFEFVDELRGATECKVCIDSLLQCRKPDLLEPIRLTAQRRFVYQTGERFPAPEAECCAQAFGGSARRPAVKRIAAFDREPLEAEGVHSVLRHVKRIARWTDRDRCARADRSAKLGYVGPHRSRGAVRRVRRPERLDQAVH